MDTPLVLEIVLKFWISSFFVLAFIVREEDETEFPLKEFGLNGEELLVSLIFFYNSCTFIENF